MLGPGVNFGPLPDATAVAARLAEQFDCPVDRGRDLARVAEYAALTQGIGPLYDELHTLFDRDHEPVPSIGSWPSSPSSWARRTSRGS